MNHWTGASGGRRRTGLWLSVAVLALLAGLAIAAPRSAATAKRQALQVAQVVKAYPHDPAAFTQGLIWTNGTLYEGTGLYGQSTLRRVDLESGKPDLVVPLDRNSFGEGITELNGLIYQLTWQQNVGLIFKLDDLSAVGSFRYSGEGWGLTTDGKHLILSDGSSVLRFIEPEKFRVVKRVMVKGPGGAVDKLNELEFVNGEVWANIWYEDRIVRISPADGRVLGWIDCRGVFPASQRDREAVMNGIAWDSASQRLFITGKNWPALYEIKLTDPQP